MVISQHSLMGRKDYTTKMEQYKPIKLNCFPVLLHRSCMNSKGLIYWGVNILD